MIRHRIGALIVLLSSLACFGSAREAWSAAEVHRLNLVLSGIPSSVKARGFNDYLDRFNTQRLAPFGVAGVKRITTAWWFDSEVRYFVTRNVALTGGVGQIRKHTSREVLPTLTTDLQIRAEVLSVPVHVGADYYLAPYNQGDFQARAYVGGGFMSLVYNRGRLHSASAGFDSLLSIQSNFEDVARGDSPGYYLEAGAHMFFATRFSVMIGGIYRSAKIRNMQGAVTFVNGTTITEGRLYDLDLTGYGARGSLAIGF